MKSLFISLLTVLGFILTPSGQAQPQPRNGANHRSVAPPRSNHPNFTAAFQKLRNLGFSMEGALRATSWVPHLRAIVDPRFASAFQTLRNLGFSMEDALSGASWVSQLDAIVDPRFPSAFQTLRNLGFSMEDALGATSHVHRLDAIVDRRFASAFQTIRNLGFSMEDTLSAAALQYPLNAIVDPRFASAFQTLRNLGFSMEGALSAAALEYPLNAIVHPRFSLAFQILRSLGASVSPTLVAGLTPNSNIDRIVDQNFILAAQNLRELGRSAESVIDDLLVWRPPVDGRITSFAHPRFLQAFRNLTDLNLSGDSALAYLNRVERTEAVGHPSFSNAFRVLRGLDIGHRGSREQILNELSTPHIVESTINPWFQQAFQNLRTLQKTPGEALAQLVVNPQNIECIGQPHFLDRYRRATAPSSARRSLRQLVQEICH